MRSEGQPAPTTAGEACTHLELHIVLGGGGVEVGGHHLRHSREGKGFLAAWKRRARWVFEPPSTNRVHTAQPQRTLARARPVNDTTASAPLGLEEGVARGVTPATACPSTCGASRCAAENSRRATDDSDASLASTLSTDSHPSASSPLSSDSAGRRHVPTGSAAAAACGVPPPGSSCCCDGGRGGRRLLLGKLGRPRWVPLVALPALLAAPARSAAGAISAGEQERARTCRCSCWCGCRCGAAAGGCCCSAAFEACAAGSTSTDLLRLCCDSLLQGLKEGGRCGISISSGRPARPHAESALVRAQQPPTCAAGGAAGAPPPAPPPRPARCSAVAAQTPSCRAWPRCVPTPAQR